MVAGHAYAESEPEDFDEGGLAQPEPEGEEKGVISNSLSRVNPKVGPF